jgi:hypothetical protein
MISLDTFNIVKKDIPQEEPLFITSDRRSSLLSEDICV